ncbi:hypothetical protein K0M31_016325 [Melipona bicolor]|uniref:Uncharacterized protein n=1 Tax=Melipona bicolor TaxID=60889 RepID=A0AA40G770_9HYME|nr:hypothetical protein K0M31_016325 [Melipona bicolor]
MRTKEKRSRALFGHHPGLEAAKVHRVERRQRWCLPSVMCHLWMPYKYLWGSPIASKRSLVFLWLRSRELGFKEPPDVYDHENYSGIVLSLFLAVSAAITVVDKHEKAKSFASRKHDKRGLVNLGYGVPEHVFGSQEAAPVIEPSVPEIGGHLESVIAPVPPPLPPAVPPAVPAVPVPVPQPVPHPFPVAVSQPVPHLVPVPVTRHVPVPVPVDRAVPVPVDRPVPVPVAVPVPKPYPVHVEKIVHVDRPVPVPFERPIHVPVDRPVAVPVPVPKPYPVPFEKVVHVDRPYPVHVAVPYHVPKPYPVPVAIHAHKAHGWFK